MKCLTRRLRLSLPLLIIMALILPAMPTAAQAGPDETTRYQRAAQYAENRRGDAVLVFKDGQLVFEAYQNGYQAETPHVLWSGTKSFSCAIAVVARMEGLLTFDELASGTITEWQSDPLRSQITIRHLLSFTSGLDSVREAPRTIRRMDSYQQAVDAAALFTPGGVYQYDSVHLLGFGEVMKRKLQAAGRNPDVLGYLEAQILNPIGMAKGEWLVDKEGNPWLPGGASYTARDWAKFGQLLLNNGTWEGRQILDPAMLAECTAGSAAMPAYGLTFWLNQPVDPTSLPPETIVPNAVDDYASTREGIYPGGPQDLYMAAGAQNQRLYIIPSHNMVVVRFARGGLWDDGVFLSLLLEDR